MFYARRTRRKTSPDQIEAWVKVDEERIFPALQRIPGFMGAYIFADRGSGEGVGFSFWESKEALESSRPAVAALRTRAEAGEVSVEVVGVDHFEVALNTGDKIHRSATHALVREFEVEPAKLDAGMELAKSTLLPAVRELPGFQGGFWLADRSTGKAITVLLVYEASLDAVTERWEQVRSASRAALTLGAKASDPRRYEIVARAPTMTGESS